MTHTDRPHINPAFSRADLLPLAGIILLSFVLYWPIFAGRPIMPDTWKRFEPWNTELGYNGPLDPRIQNANNDAILLYIPWNAFAHRELQAGRFPAWDPYCMMGVPLASNHLVPVLYPIYALIAWLVSPLFIMGVSGLVHTLILCIFFYLFLREWLGSIRPPPVVSPLGGDVGEEAPKHGENIGKTWTPSPPLGGTTGGGAIRFAAWLTASFLMVSMLPNPHYQPWPMTLAFFPGIWFFYERWLKHRSPFAGVWMALCWAVPLIAGYPSLVFQLSAFTIVWILLPRPSINFRSRLAILIWPLVLGIGLSAIQNIPTIIAARESDRTTFKSSTELAHEASFTIPQNEPWQEHVKRLTQPFIPWKFAKNDFLNRGYVGLFSSMLALIGLFWFRDRRYPKTVLLLALIAAAFALVPVLNFAAYALLRGVTIDPNPPLEVLGLLILVLSAVSLLYLMEAETKASYGRYAILAIPVIACLIFLFGARREFSSIYRIAAWSVAAGCLMSMEVIRALKAKRAIEIDRGLLIGWSFILAFAGFSASLEVLCPGVFDSDPPMPETQSIQHLKASTEGVQFGPWGRIIRWDPGPVNVMSMSQQPYLFYPNLGTYFGIPDAFGYFNLAPKNRMDYLRSIQEDAVIERRGIVSLTGDTTWENSKLSPIGVSLILSKDKLPNSEVTQNPRWVEHSHPKRRAFHEFVNPDAWRRVTVRSEQELASRDGTWSFSNATPFQSQQVKQVANPEPAYAKFTVTGSDSFRPVSAWPQVLVFNEGYSQGWRATVDGSPVQIRPVNNILIGVELPRGDHVVEFHYTLPGLIAGAIISILFAIICVLISIRAALSRPKPS